MKKIYKSLLLGVIAALPVMFTACEDDNDSNPVLNTVPASFVLNNSELAANNVYDLPYGTINLTCSQPDYGGWPAAVTYAMQMSLNQNTWTELPASYPTPDIKIDGSLLNDLVLEQYRATHNDEDPAIGTPVYLRSRAFLSGVDGTQGECYSNVVTVKVYAWEAPVELTLPTDFYVCGGSIGTAWSTWKPAAPVYGKEGRFYTLIRNNADGFKWGNKPNDWFGYDKIDEFEVNVDGLEVSTDNDGNIVFNKAGWYTLEVIATIKGKAISYKMIISEGSAYVIGAGAGGDWTDSNPEWAMTPEEGTNNWVSPAFSGNGEMRAYIKVPGEDWWRTEFTLFEGGLYWRVVDIPHNWNDDLGAEYSVAVSAGQKLYVDFDNLTGEVK